MIPWIQIYIQDLKNPVIRILDTNLPITDQEGKDPLSHMITANFQIQVLSQLCYFGPISKLELVSLSPASLEVLGY